MNRSLTPLIVSFAVVILLTIIMLHTRPNRLQDEELPGLDLAPPMRLSPFPGHHQPKVASGVASPTSSNRQEVPVEVDELVDISRRLLAEGREAEAEDRLRTLLVFSPEHMPALSLLGGILFYSRRYGEAESIYRRQVLTDPASATVHNNLASTLARQERYLEALASAEQASQLEPEAPPVLTNLASICLALGEQERALGYFRQAYKLLGWKILPIAEDPVFRKLRNHPDFAAIVNQARQEWEAAQVTPSGPSPAATP